MAKFDVHKNFALSTVATAPSPAASGTSLVVAGGDGTKFPAVPFNAVIFPTGANPTTANAEVVRVTNISTDTFTITRQQEGTSARTVVIGDQIMDAETAKVFQDYESLFGLQTQSATDMDVVLPASNNFTVIDVLEIGSANSFEIAATSTLEIKAVYDYGNTQWYGEMYGDLWDSADALKQSIVLPNGNYFAFQQVEIAVGNTLEIPAGGSLEILAIVTQGDPTATPLAPVGSLTMFAGVNIPNGWLVCQGQTVSRSTYATLFSVIGVAFGAGDGSTTFALPDFRGRSPMGVGTGSATGASAWALGSQPTSGAGGEESHTLTSAELTTHLHGYNAQSIDNSANGSNQPMTKDQTADRTPSTNNSGSGGAHNTTHPVSVVNFIIKT